LVRNKLIGSLYEKQKQQKAILGGGMVVPHLARAVPSF